MVTKTRKQLEQDPAIVTVREKSGREVRSNVHGSGGAISFLSGPAYIEALILRATEGGKLGVYEPQPGHVRFYWMRRDGREEETDVDLRGATLVAFEISKG